MAKSGRHKKLRKQEKAKTQLKGNKVLAKAQNVIEPKLRAKKILIREQLKSKSAQSPAVGGHQLQDSDGEVESIVDSTVEATTRRKQSLQEVLTSLNHHNKNIKKDALNGLLEIVSTQGDLLIANLDRILEKIGALTSDLEGIVRKENLRVAEIIFAQVNEDQVRPFWNLLLTHVKCTLTNLNPTIRYSCLSFMTLLISYFPNLTSNSKHIILPNLLGLISTTTSPTITNSATAVSPHTSKFVMLQQKSKLKSEISDRHSDMKERLRVLSLISSCLGLKPKDETQQNQSNVNQKNSGNQFSFNNIDMSKINNSYGYQEHQRAHGDISLGFVDNSSSMYNNHEFGGNRAEEAFKNSNNFWPQFIQSCLPILWEIWLEVRPSLKDDKSNRSNVNSGDTGGSQKQARGLSSLPSLTVEYLECIVTVMSTLLLQQNVNQGVENINGSSFQTTEDGQIDLMRFLRKNHGQNLRKYFLNWLPFSAVQDTQRKIVTSVNLELYHIASQLRLVDENLMNSLENYIRVLTEKSILDSSQTTKVFNILTLIHIERAGSLMSEVINYGLESDHYDSVNVFLLQTLTPTSGNMNSEENFILRAIDWENVVNQLVIQSLSINSQMLKILSLIGMRKLIKFSKLLEENFAKLQGFLKAENDSIEAWDEVVRLFYMVNCLDYFEKEKITVPEPSQEVMNQLLSICAT